MARSYKRRKIYAFPSAGTAAYAMSRARQGLKNWLRTGSTKARNPRNHGGVTDQHDVSRMYRKKKMPPRQKRKWKRWVKKVKAVIDNDRCLKSIIYNKSFSIATNNTGNQAVGIVHLNGCYGADSSYEYGTTDLFQLITGDGALLSQDKKIIIQSAVLDITIRSDNDNSNTIELDIYDFYCKGTSMNQSVGAMLTAAATETTTVGGGGFAYTPITLDQRGVSPFELPLLLGQITVLKKTKYIISPGKAITYQYRDPKNRTYSCQQILDNNRLSSKGKGHHGILMVAKQVVTNTDAYTVHNIDIGATRSYHYTYEGLNKYEDGYRTI